MFLSRTREKNKNREGFTLAELLVVVAIIAILVAVSIPIFTGKLEEARQNTDLANERAAKAAAIADYLQSGEEKNYGKHYDASTGKMLSVEAGYPEGYNQVAKKYNSNLAEPNNAAIFVSIVSSDGKTLEITTQWVFVKKVKR